MKPFYPILLVSLLGCAPLEQQDQDLYQAERARAAEAIDKLNQLQSQNFESDKLHRELASLLSRLDDQASACRLEVNEIRSTLHQESEFILDMRMQTLQIRINAALATISELEKKASKDVFSQLEKNIDTTIAPEGRSAARELYDAQRTLLSQLAGMRDLFIGMQNDLTEDANARLAELRRSSGSPSPAAPRTAPIDPVVSSNANGGRITGLVRDAVTGTGLANASVGFRTLDESTDYFYRTTTNNAGAYQSPFLLPGEYFVDIRHPDYIGTRAERVQVEIGRDAQENVSVTKPIGDAAFRVTVSWTGPKVGAVQDVDSYLVIPGATEPLSYRLARHDYHGAHLDRDDTDWTGPETITIKELQRSGTYIYYVNNFNRRSDEAALGESDINVFLYRGKDTEVFQTFRVPAGTGATYELFRIENGVFRQTGRFNDNLTVY